MLFHILLMDYSLNSRFGGRSVRAAEKKSGSKRIIIL